jgi:hypothetical protein
MGLDISACVFRVLTGLGGLIADHALVGAGESRSRAAGELTLGLLSGEGRAYADGFL